MEIFSAPQLDKLLRIFELDGFNPKMYDRNVKEKLYVLYDNLYKIKSQDDKEDIKTIYFSLPKGTIEQYGDYEELKEFGEVTSYEEFEENFKSDYPDDFYWYKLVTSRYQNYRMISINSKVILYTDINEGSIDFEDNTLQSLLDLLIDKVKDCIKMLKKDTYNDYINKNLSYKNRFGVIKRSDYWKLCPFVKKKMLEELSQKEINDFVEHASEKVDRRIKNMTSSKYFECVRLALQNNNYDIDNLSDREVYLKYADGRDGGLSELDLNNSLEFDNWYQDKSKFGAHPWEIMRGHSFSRINLFVRYDEKGYYLSLDGNIVLRKIEIVKIFLALHKNNIPIQIYNVDLIKKALIGEDYIGVVPDYVFPISCSGYFKEYKPVEFINIDYKKIIDYVIWEKIDNLYLK